MIRLRYAFAMPVALSALLVTGAVAQAGPTSKAAIQSPVALNVEVPPVVKRSKRVGPADPNKVLHLAVSLPYADPEGMQAYVNSLNDPKSPLYHKYLTPDQVGQWFGLPQTAVQSVVNHLESKGIKVTLVGKNHLSILADATVSQAEAAFGTTINQYKAAKTEAGNPDYVANMSTPKLPPQIAPFVADVTGLDTFTKPQHRALTPDQTRTLYNLAPAYNAGYRGEGRTVAISNFDGFRLTNVPLYYSHFGLPTPSGGVGSNITVVTISGGAGSGTAQGEADLDIQMVLGMAPLCNFIIYDGGSSDLIGTLTREVNDNSADVISESYGWNISTSTANSAHNLHLSMSAQGITYMAASGDSGTTIEPYSYPNYDPEVLMVGGTVATVNGSGVRTSEVGWSGSGGGWSTKSFTWNTRPSWQAGTGVPTTINYRMSPDVSLHASSGSGAYQFYYNGSLTSGYVGTSFACPVFAGSLAVAEQKIIALGGLPANGAGKQRFGRIQDLFYSQNGRSDVWLDITSGSNGTLPNGSSSTCTTGWDTVTGWGAINFDAFVATQAGTPTLPAVPSGLVATAGNAQVSLSWSASSGATSYNVKRATTSGGPYTVIGTPTSPNLINTGLANGTTYYYVVSAVNSVGESANSSQVSATPAASTSAQLLLNPGFESGSASWTASSGVITNSTSRSPHGGSYYAWLNGYGRTHTDTLYQQVTIPSTVSSATLSLYLHIDTSENTSTVQRDKLQIQIRSTSNGVLATLGTFSNLNAISGFTKLTYNLNAYKGQTIRVYLVGTENNSRQTSFVVDDFALDVN
ncbi:MAG: hypothetical protein BGO01_00340 [Armatimonadetes bacterium 55-13]|nr:hypothetical protein [Armatimonadota bacterium]OJU63148.1 MAG: hypothetical protein BGO01_00340 [Armatimonadetes bacterium 55-13]